MNPEINGSSLAYPVLSEREKEVLKQLKKIEKSSIWLEGIKTVFDDFDAIKFRELICQLKEAAGHNPTSMKRILGDCYESVIGL